MGSNNLHSDAASWYVDCEVCVDLLQVVGGVPLLKGVLLFGDMLGSGVVVLS